MAAGMAPATRAPGIDADVVAFGKAADIIAHFLNDAGSSGTVR